MENSDFNKRLIQEPMSPDLFSKFREKFKNSFISYYLISFQTIDSNDGNDTDTTWVKTNSSLCIVNFHPDEMGEAIAFLHENNIKVDCVPINERMITICNDITKH